MRIRNWLLVTLALLLLSPAACAAQPAEDDAAMAPEAGEILPEEDGDAAEAPADEAAEAPVDPYNLGGREILVGTDPTYEPFESVDADGKIVGIDPDLMQAICEIVNCTPVFQGTSWDGIFAALKAGEFDVLMSAITILAEREENSDATFTDPYFRIGQVILVRGDDETIAGVESLPDSVVGVQNGTTGDTAATDAGVPDDRLRRYDTIPLAIQALLGADIDAVVLDSAPAEKAITTAEDGALRIVGEAFTREDYGILVPNASPELLEAFNHAIERLRASGKLDRIVEGWMGDADEGDADAASEGAETSGEEAGADATGDDDAASASGESGDDAGGEDAGGEDEGEDGSGDSDSDEG